MCDQSLDIEPGALVERQRGSVQMLSRYCPGPRRQEKLESGQGGKMRWDGLWGKA